MQMQQILCEVVVIITRKDLNNCAALRSLAESDRWELDRLMDLATGCTVQYGKEAVQTSRSNDRLGDLSARMADIQRQYEDNIGKYLDHVEQVKTAINGLSDPGCRQIMSLRYVEGLLWEDVAEHVGYSLQACYIKHNEALFELGI